MTSSKPNGGTEQGSGTDDRSPRARSGAGTGTGDGGGNPRSQRILLLLVWLLAVSLGILLLNRMGFFQSPSLDAFAPLPWWERVLGWGLLPVLLLTLLVATLGLVKSLLYPKASREDARQRAERESRRRELWMTIWLLFGAGLIGLGLAANQAGLLEAAKAAMQNRTAVFALLLLAMVGIYPLTYLAYRAFGVSTHRGRLKKDFRLLGLEKDEDVDDTVNQLYNTIYSGLQFAVYIGLIVLISTCVLYAYYGCTPITLSGPGGTGMLRCANLPSAAPVQVTAIFFAYLGAFVFSVQELVRRYSTYDLQPQVYAAIVVRMLIAIGIVFVAQLVFEADAEDQGIWAASAFLIGTFPTIGIQYLSQKASGPLGAAEPIRSLLPLGNIQGISAWHESRLIQMGIDDAQNLATADLRRLLLTTQFDAGQIVSWVDQAILYVKVQDRLERFRETGIYGNHQLVQELGKLFPDVDPAVANGGQGDAQRARRLEVIAAALNLNDVNDLRRLISSQGFTNAEHIEVYYRNSRLVTREYARGSMREDLLAGPLKAFDGIVDVSGAHTEGTDLDPATRAELERLARMIEGMLASGEDARLLNSLGVALTHLGRYQGALDAFDRATAEDPRLALAYANRGLLHIREGRIQAALRDTTTAIRLDRANAKAVCNRGIAYLKQGATELAIADFDAALQLDLRFAPCYLHRGMAHLEQGEPDPAIADLQRAELLGIETAELYSSWGIALAAKQDHGGAIRRLSLAIGLEPGSADTHVERGMASMQLGRLDAAVLDYDRAMAICTARAGVDTAGLEPSRSPERLGELGGRIAEAHLQQGRPDRARARLEEVVGASPWAYDAWFRLALIQERWLNDEAGACASCRAIIDAQPTEDAPHPALRKAARELVERLHC